MNEQDKWLQEELDRKEIEDRPFQRGPFTSDSPYVCSSCANPNPRCTCGPTFWKD